MDYIAKDDSGAKEGTCIFCGKFGKLTGEHIFGHWTTKAVQPENRKEVILTLKLDGKVRVDHIDLTKFKRPRDQGHANMRLNVLCRECNNGWGSDLQDTASQVLKPVISGERWALSDAERETVAKWITSLMMVRQYLHPELLALNEDVCKEFYRTRAPMAGLSIWVGKYSGENSHECRYRAAFVTTEGNPLPEKPNVCSISLVMGDLIFFAFWSSEERIIRRFSTPFPGPMQILNMIAEEHGTRKWTPNPTFDEDQFEEYEGPVFYPLHVLLANLGMTQVWPTFEKYSDAPLADLTKKDFIELNDLATYAVVEEDSTLEYAREYASKEAERWEQTPPPG